MLDMGNYIDATNVNTHFICVERSFFAKSYKHKVIRSSSRFLYIRGCKKLCKIEYLFVMSAVDVNVYPVLKNNNRTKRVTTHVCGDVCVVEQSSPETGQECSLCEAVRDDLVIM